MTFQPSAQPAPAAAASVLGWSPAQVVRLENEWKRLRRSFACHPFVQVTPMAGDPPGEFQVQYKVRTLAFNDQNVLTYITGCPIHIWLPPQFPHSPPAVRPVGSVFHPNVTPEWIYLPQSWHPGMWLEQVVTTVGQLLAYQTWDPNQNANPMAMDWLAQNQHLCPIDPFATFGADAEGGPAARLAKSGAEHLDPLRKRVLRMCDRLTTVSPPDGAELLRFAQQTRQILTSFTDAEAPEDLRKAATGVDEVVRSMQGRDSAWETLGRAFAIANDDATAAESLAQAVEAMGAAHETLVGLAPQDNHRGDPVSVLLGLPPAPLLQAPLLDLRRAVRKAEELISEMQERSEASDRATVPLPKVTASEGSLLHERLTADVARAKQAAETTKSRMGEVIASSGRALDVGRLRATAAERVVEWAEYADVLRRADLLVRKITQFGPDGIQTFSLRIADAMLGPFEYEQRLDDVASLRYAVSSVGTSLALIDTRSGVPIAHVDAGNIATSVKGKNDQPVTLVVHPSAFNDELLVQFEYLLSQSKERFTRLSVQPAIPLTDSWLGEHEAFFRMTASRMALMEENKQRRQRWKGVLLDLAALGKFKNRLATYFLLERVGDLIPRVQAEFAKAQERLDAANRRLAEIAARSSRDMASGRLIIPAKFAQEYSQRTADRDRAHRDMPRFENLLHNAAQQVRLRLAVPKFVGAEGLPAFYVVPPLAEHWADFEAVLSDADLLARVENLEAELGTQLRPDGRPLFGAAAEVPAPSSGTGAPNQATGSGIPVARVVSSMVPPPGLAGPAATLIAAARNPTPPVPSAEPDAAAYAGGLETDAIIPDDEYTETADYAQPAVEDSFAIIDDSEQPEE